MTAVHDVVVLGAGLSGLHAAHLLRSRGARVRVLEARDRVGGRTWSRTIGRARFDVGGQWIGPGQRRMHALVGRLGIPTFEQHVDGAKVLLLGDRRSVYRSDIPSLGLRDLATMPVLLGALDVARRLGGDPRLAPGPATRRLHALSLATVADRMNPRVRGVFDAALRTIFGAEAGDLSLADFLAYLDAGEGLLSLAEARGGAQQTRFVDGAQTVSERLAEGLDVRLDAPVHEVRRAGEVFEVVTPGEVVRGAQVVSALPPNLLAKVAFTPALPPPLRAHLEAYAMGRTTKVLLTYERAAWRDRGLSGELVSDGLVSIVMDATSADLTQPALVGFVVGANADRLAAMPESAREAAVRAPLERAFGDAAAHPTSVTMLPWKDEPYTGGCPVACLPAGAPLLDRALEVPGLHFAGTEFAREYRGYMEGALEAAERAAAGVGVSA